MKSTIRNTQYAILITLILAWLILPQTAQAATYYLDAVNGLDTNPGTEAQPWKTVAYALGTASSVGPGDTVYLRGGTYYESVPLYKWGTEAGGNVTLKNYPAEAPIMDGTVAVTGWTQAVESDPYLTVVIGGNNYAHPNYANIYWARVAASNFPANLDSTVLFEDHVQCRIASDPDQSEGFGELSSELRDVHPDCYGQDAYLYDTALTEESGYWEAKTGYWDKPIVRVLVYNANNNVRRSTVESYDKLPGYGKITFTTPLGYTLSVGYSYKDRYRLVNHPHALDSPGEYYISAIENVGGIDYRRIYYWPKVVENLTDKVCMASKASAFYRNSYKGGYLAIEGIKVFGYKSFGIRFSATSGNNGANLIIKNCEITDNGDTGIYINYYDKARVEGNYIRRCNNRGVLVTNGDQCVIKGNDSRENAATNLSFYSVTNSMMVANTVGGQRATHGNGTSCYGVDSMIENLLVANNVYYACNSSFQNVKNVTLFANIYFVDDAHRAWPINNWPRAQTQIGHEGFFVYLHNTVYDARYASTEEIYHAVNAASPHADFAPLGAEAGPCATWYMYNNIYHGFASWQNENWTNGTPRRRIYRENNIHTWYMWQQRATYGWSLNTGEVECFIHAVPGYKSADHILADIFVDPVYGAGDWSPKQNGPAHGTGRDVQQLLSDLGIKDKFPDFDFTKDIAGRPWVDSPSIGAYEYASSLVLYGDVNNDKEITAYDAALAAHIAVDLEHPDIKNRAAAEVSGDGEVTAYDAALIAQRAVGLIEKFPVEQ